MQQSNRALAVLMRALTLIGLAGGVALLAPACSGNSSGNSGGCAIGGSKCAYGCTANLGCTQCVSNADCQDSGKPACVLGQCRECGSGAGCGAGQACFPKDSKCEAACAADTDCPGDAPLCLTDAGVCVGCVTNADCADKKDTPICDGNRGQCSACASPVDCGAANPVCDLNDGKCHECLVDSDCRAPQVCGVNRKCHEICSSNLDCDEAGKPFCELGSGECVECLARDDCPAAAPACDKGKCIVCGVDADCADPAAPFCKGDQCVACAEDAQCPDALAPFCEADVCVQCKKDDDCPDPALSKCADHACVAP